MSKKVAIGIAGGVVIATLALLQTSRRGTATETPIAVPSQITLTGRSELAAISPDGAYLAYIERTDSGERILVQDVAAGGNLELGLYGAVWSLHWHPNGSDLLVAGIDLGGRPRLIVLSRFGGEPRRLQRFLPFAKWAPDGQRVVMWSMDSRWLEVIDPFGRDSIRVPLPEGVGFLGGLDWSPDGQRFAIMTWHPARGQYLVRIVAADGAYAYEVVRDTVELAGPLWTPDGGGVYYFRASGATAELKAVEITEDGRSVREPATMLSGVPALNAAGGFGERPPWLTISANGSRMLFPRDDGRANLWTGSTERNGGPLTQGSRGTGVKSYPRFSPNGDAVAYIEAARGQMDVWIDTLTVGRPRRLTFDGTYKDQLAWSPDGSRLAYGGRQGGNVILHTVDMDGVVREYPGSTIGQSLGWLDDGAVVHGSSENAQLLRYRFADGSSEPLLEQRTGYEFSPRVSPDGQHLAFWRNLGRGDADIWILGLDEGPLRRVGAGDYVPIGWESEGTHIVAMPFRLGTSVYTIHESEGSVRPVSELSLASWPDQVDYHANTGAIVAALKEERVDIWMIEDFDPRRR